jgi:HEPN domain-containing protein
VTSDTLARSYFQKARKRKRALETLFEDEAYSDVGREAQELVELVLKGMLRFVGVEPPKRVQVFFLGLFRAPPFDTGRRP